MDSVWKTLVLRAATFLESTCTNHDDFYMAFAASSASLLGAAIFKDSELVLP